MSICKPNPELIKAVSRAISKSVGEDTCEIWGDDKIIIKALQSGIKSLIAVAFINHLKQNLGGCATSDTIMQTNVGQLAPYVAWWIVKPH
jgi:hypothetical protein